MHIKFVSVNLEESKNLEELFVDGRMIKRVKAGTRRNEAVL
jgi:hypothetical protein